MNSKLKIAMITPECVPYAKTGGLADVVGALPAALKELGHEVIVIMPLYASIDYAGHKLSRRLESMGVWMGTNQEWCSVHEVDNNGVTVYFIESLKYFNRPGLYHDQDMNDYLDNPFRFGFLTQAGLQLCKDLNFKPDVVHAHDWQTALAPAFLKIWHWNDPILGSAASLLTIHNIAYQGVYPVDCYDYLGLRWDNFSPSKFEDHGKINFMKGGVVYADIVNTVSPTYANETRTPVGGYGLAPYLNDKGDRYIGILNGVDYTRWNPATDRQIPALYSHNDLTGKSICKHELQARFQLEVDRGIPVIGVVSRLVAQKGLNLLAQAIETILATMRVQFVILGAGDKGLEAYYGSLPGRFPGRVGSYIGYSEELAHWIEAGSDFFIMPSIYEPCGLNQIYSLKYGTLPIVRATGGLDDTVDQYNEITGDGTGFKFWAADVGAVYYTVGWAISTFYDRPQHIQQMMRRAMQEDYSWEKSAEQYVTAYQRAMGIL